MKHTMQPELPLTKLAVQRGVAYLVTYKSEWIHAVKKDKGEIDKRAHCLTYDRRIVGSILVMAVQAMLILESGFFRTMHNSKTT